MVIYMNCTVSIKKDVDGYLVTFKQCTDYEYEKYKCDSLEKTFTVIRRILTRL